MIILALIAVIYLLSAWLSPFPHWPSYFKIWRYVLFKKEPAISFASRCRQGVYLSRYLLLNPLWACLWYLDDFFFPDYQKIKFRPIFIIGQARSGTTFLHRTLAVDKENFVAVRHLDWRYPYICLQKIFKFLGLEERLAAANYWPDTEKGRAAAKMHPNTLADWEEDGVFYEENFMHYWYNFLRFPYPDLAWHQEGVSVLSESYQWHMLKIMRKAVQKVFYLRGVSGKIFISKEVTSHDKVEKMMKLYPDACFIISIRNSEEYMSSLSMLVQTSTITKTGIDPYTIPGWMETFIERMRLDTFRLIRLCEEVIPEDRQIRLAFHHTTARTPEIIAHIYRRFGLEMGGSYIRYLEQLEIKQRGRQRGYEYNKSSFAGFEEHDRFFNQVCSEVDQFLGVASGFSEK